MAQKVNIDDIKEATEGKVIIKKEAFRNMVTHVLRYGSTALDDSVEVMGVCMGKQAPNKKDLIVVNAIPITHGSSVEVGFSPEDYVAFAELDEKFASEGLYAVGWYHSHPGWGLFFSDTDIRNHLFYQKEQTPYAFGIVFDHTIMGQEGDFGFEVYRLDDHNKGTAANYIKVPYELEIPSTLEYFRWVQKFIEDSQKKNPVLIKELNEMGPIQPTKDELQEIPIPDGVMPEEAKLEKYPQIVPIITGFQEGVKKLNESFAGTFKDQIGLWSNDVKEGATKGSRLMRNTLSEMKDAISFGMDKVKGWFEKNLEEIISEFKTDVTEYLQIRIKAQKELVKDLPGIQEEITKGINTAVQDKINGIIEEINKRSKVITEAIDNASKDNVKIEELVNKSSESVGNIATEIAKFSEDLGKEIDASLGPLESNISKELVQLNSELKTIKDNYSNAKEVFEKLQKAVMEIRNL